MCSRNVMSPPSLICAKVPFCPHPERKEKKNDTIIFCWVIVLSISDVGDLHHGLNCCKAMAKILVKMLEKGKKFIIPEVIWNVFDRPNPPLEKRRSLSPNSAKIMEASQSASTKRRHEEEEEDGDGKTSHDRKDAHERDHEREHHRDVDKERTEGGADREEAEESHSFPEGTEDAVVRLRGLPWSIKEDEIRQFFKDVTIAPGGVHFEIDATGKRNGEGYIRLLTTKEAEVALKYDRQHIGQRYVEVFPSSLQEMEDSKARRKSSLPRSNEFLVKMRGLPFSITERDIIQFFRGLKFPRDWVTIVSGPGGRMTGEAFVEFHNDADMKKALSRDREKIGTRYVELFASTAAEMNAAVRKADGASLLPFPHNLFFPFLKTSCCRVWRTRI